MPRFLSPDWVAAFDAALGGVTVPGPDENAGLRALDGRFTVVQQVRGTPDGDLALLLEVADGSLHLSLAGRNDPEPAADVFVVLSYEDAAAMSVGALSPAEALTAGRIRVRGDLSVLVASQQMLAAARPHVQELAAATTY